VLSDNGDHVMTKLSDTQLGILSAAAQRGDGAILPLPRTLRLEGGAVDKVLGSLEAKGLIDRQGARAATTRRHSGSPAPASRRSASPGSASPAPTSSAPSAVSNAPRAPRSAASSASMTTACSAPPGGVARRSARRLQRALRPAALA
jgi:hypothetical protein